MTSGRSTVAQVDVRIYEDRTDGGRFGTYRVPNLLSAPRIFPEGAHAASEPGAELVVDEESHAARALSNVTAASTSADSRLIQEATSVTFCDSAW